MKFWQRFKYYGIGFGFGLLAVYFFFGNRSCTWTPENRVKQALKDKLIVLSPKNRAKLKSIGISTADCLALLENGDVNFGNSIKHENPQIYLFDGESSTGKSFRVQFELRRNDAFVSRFEPLTDEKPNRQLATAAAQIIHLPKDSALIAFNDKAKCQAKEYQLTEKKHLGGIAQRVGSFFRKQFETYSKTCLLL